MSSLPSSEPFFKLQYDNYVSLSEAKEGVLKEVEAMRTIVSTANMNPEVLMREVLAKRKRAISRIDASTEGQNFLYFLLNEDTGVDKTPIQRRILIGEKLSSARNSVNRQLAEKQKQWLLFTVDDLNRRILLLRFIDDMVRFLNSGSVETILLDEFDDELDFNVNLFVNSVLVEELEYLRVDVNRKPKNLK